MPIKIQKIMLLNPFAFIVNFAKQGLISNSYTSVWYFMLLSIGIIIAVIGSFMIFRKYEKTVAELI